MAMIQVNGTLEDLNVAGCAIASTGVESGKATFNPRAAAGFYSLQLDDPVDRTIALQLITLGTKFPKSWVGEKLDGRLFDFNAKVRTPPSHKGPACLVFAYRCSGSRHRAED